MRAIEANGIRPVVDKEVFTLEKAREAYEYMVGFLTSSPSMYDISLTPEDTVGSEAFRKNRHQDRVTLHCFLIKSNSRFNARSHFKSAHILQFPNHCIHSAKLAHISLKLASSLTVKVFLKR